MSLQAEGLSLKMRVVTAMVIATVTQLVTKDQVLSQAISMEVVHPCLVIMIIVIPYS